MSDTACFQKDNNFKFVPPEGASKNDAATLEALHAAVSLDIFGYPSKHQTDGQPFALIADGKGPYQAIKCALPHISNEGAASLAHMINQANHKQEYKSGDSLSAPPNGLGNLLSADIRVAVHLPLSATAAEVDQAYRDRH